MRRINYNTEGDNFQADALCQYGFCYQFFFWNYPVPHKYTKMGLSPLHASTMELFDTVYDEYHQFAMGNLYDYSAFSGAAYNNKFKVLCHDVMRKFGRGLPPSVIHKELKIKKVQLEAQRTTNASVLQGEPK